MDSQRNSYLVVIMIKTFYCSRNVLAEYRNGVGARYCDGPKGNGVERKCKKTCENFCGSSKKLQEQTG